MSGAAADTQSMCFVVDLKFACNWVCWVFSGSPQPAPSAVLATGVTAWARQSPPLLGAYMLVQETDTQQKAGLSERGAGNRPSSPARSGRGVGAAHPRRIFWKEGLLTVMVGKRADMSGTAKWHPPNTLDSSVLTVSQAQDRVSFFICLLVLLCFVVVNFRHTEVERVL